MKNTSNIVKLLVVGAFLLFACFAVQGLSTAQNRQASDGPLNQGTRAARQDGNERSGRDVFRFETFGNEGFWTDAVRLPAGVVAAKVTPLQALQLGLQVDVDALDDATRKAVAAELKKDPTTFHEAEAYHQGYAARHPDQPYIVVHDLPKVENLRKLLPELYAFK